MKSESKEESSKSKTQIKKFVDFYGINMDDFEPSNINDYSSFQDFFTRKHNPKARPIAERDNPVYSSNVVNSLV